MTWTFTDNNNVYSVDMMFAYINIFKPKYIKIAIDDLISTLEYKSWYNKRAKKYIRPLDVIDNPKKYADEMEKVQDADLNYPIIINNTQVIEGVHRLTKAFSLGKKYINAYHFDDNLMKKFLIDKSGDWKITDRLEPSIYIELFYKRFLKSELNLIVYVDKQLNLKLLGNFLN